MPENEFFAYRQVIQAPVDLIYRAFTSATALREWLCDVSTVNPEVGGRLFLAWNRGYFASGAFQKLDKNSVIEFSWIGKGEPGWSEVHINISLTAVEGQYQVDLTHQGIGQGNDWEEARREIHKGWSFGMENLKSTLEDGRDLRQVKRPLIGIYPDDVSHINESTKLELGISVNQGVFVNEVVPDLGASLAGIQPKDVIVAIDGKAVNNIRALSAVMSDVELGDALSIEVFRGSEKMHFVLDTMLQKEQDIPDSPEELAKLFEANSMEALDQLEKVLSNVTEIEASFTPGLDEWSIKEIIVHLIHNERDMHSWINDLVSGQVRFYDEWPDNNLLRIRATLTSYPNLTELMAELRRSLKETVACIAFLDHGFTRRKMSYRKLGLDVLGSTKHVQEHIKQIEDNLKAVRANQIQ